MKPILLFALVINRLWANDAPKAPLPEKTSNIVAHDDDIIELHAATRVATLLVLPEQEKALGAFCGDRTYWNVDIIPGAERFISVKPSKPGIQTDIHILTDHGHSYTIRATEMTDGSVPVDLKMSIRPADETTLQRPPVLVSAAEADRLKQQLAAAQKEVEDTKKSAQRESKQSSDAFRASYPGKLEFCYKFERDKDPFNVKEVWRDEKFTYIKAYPSEQPALYELKDGKPNLTEYEIKEGGTLYVISKILDTSYLQIGKKRLEIWREKQGT